MHRGAQSLVRGVALIVVLLVVLGWSLSACAGAPSRSVEIAAAFTRADEADLRSRPIAVRTKYARMALSLYDFYRGSMPVFRRDLVDPASVLGTSLPVVDGLVFGIGDAHPENFGTLRASDGTLALEPNDLDGADRVSYVVDLRRLTVGLVLAARLSSPDDLAAHDALVARLDDVLAAALSSYRSSLARELSSPAHLRITAPTDAADRITADLFERSLEGIDERGELTDFTVVEGGVRRLRRGVLDPAEPTELLLDLPPFARAALASTLRDTAVRRGESTAEFTVLDVAAHLGSGIASSARVRALALVRGPTDAPEDDRLVDVKELTDSAAPGTLGAGVYARSPRQRIEWARRGAWAREDADATWTTGVWLGLDVQLRAETDAHRTFRVRRLTGRRAEPRALIEFATHLGALLARVHATEATEGAMVSRALAARDEAQWVADETRVARSYADRVEADFELFRALLVTEGPWLGFTPDPADAPMGDIARFLSTFGGPT